MKTLLIFFFFLLVNFSFSQSDKTDSVECCFPYAPKIVMSDCDLSTDDGFNIYLLDDEVISGYKMMVFNRWGEIVFQSTDPDEKWYPWDHKLPEGVYIWAIQENLDEDFDAIPEKSKFKYKGHVTYIIH